MVNKEKVFEFLDLKSLISREIEVYGKASAETTNRYAKLVDDLSVAEVDFLVEFTSQFK